MPRELEDMVMAWERSALDATPLGFGEMKTWGDSIPRVLRTLGCMTQARWAWVRGKHILIESPPEPLSASQAHHQGFHLQGRQLLETHSIPTPRQHSSGQ